MAPEEDGRPEDAEDWAAEREETTPEFMEPVVELDEGEEVDPSKTRTERDAKAATLYRERRVVEELTDEEPPEEARPKLTREERRALRERRRLEREVARIERANGSRVRSTLVYKTFYDMVCNRVGVIVAGFGVAMILFTVSYDWLQGHEFSLGAKHWTALIISIAVYGLGMVLEAMRILSPECEGLETKALRAQATGNGAGRARREREDHKPIPMIPEDALEKLNGGRDRE